MAWLFFVAILVILLSFLAIWLSGSEAEKELDDAQSESKSSSASPCSGCAFAGHACVNHCTMHGGFTKRHYFHDGELDFFMGRSADRYTEEEVNMFRRTLYSLHGSEVNEWCRNLRQRGIEIPEQIKTDVLIRLKH